MFLPSKAVCLLHIKPEELTGGSQVLTPGPEIESLYRRVVVQIYTNLACRLFPTYLGIISDSWR